MPPASDAKHREAPRYDAYILRRWEVRSTLGDDATSWRFSVEDSRTGEKHGFADVDVLLSYLRSRLVEADQTLTDR